MLINFFQILQEVQTDKIMKKNIDYDYENKNY